eukprot:TRINITY_DN5425_c0_g2_i2.p1 TRINITY_DN5425_c0_g2~~TRINITY_DN5425_c0_g2_i2.p1  ORF type:complete len:892 (+),score=293.20 TRINITY_DN5425_c0_g2_i2:321-2678(+)
MPCEPGDDADDVLYDADVGVQLLSDVDPTDETQWHAGPPPHSIVYAMALPLSFQAPEMQLAELLTESEVRNVLLPRALDTQGGALAGLVSAAASADLTSSRHSGLLAAGSSAHSALAALASAATGAGLEGAAGWKSWCGELVRAGAADALTSVFLRAGGSMQSTATFLQHPSLQLALRLCLTGLCGMAAAVGAECVASGGQDGLALALALLKEVPSAPALPAKKLLLYVDALITSIAGPADPTPKCWRHETPTQPSRWAGDGAVEQYIGSVLSSGAAGVAPLAHLSADLLRALHYRYWSSAVARRQMGQPAAASDLLALPAPAPFGGVPLPVREALAVYAATLAEAVQAGRAPPVPLAQAGPACAGSAGLSAPGAVESLAGLEADALVERLTELADAGAADAGAGDTRRQISLTPEFPPRWEAHLQPSTDGWISGAPPPSMWPLAIEGHLAGTEGTTPAAVCYKALLDAGLRDVVLAMLKVFLAALPGEDAAAGSCDAELHVFGKASEEELRRHRGILLRLVPHILLRLLKLFRQGNCPGQSVVLLDAISADTNGLRLFVKYLHQNSVHSLTGIRNVPEGGWDEALEVPNPLPSSEAAHVPWVGAEGCPALSTLTPCRVLLDDGDHGFLSIECRALLALVCVLRLLQKLSRRQPQKLCIILQHKVYVLLRRKLSIGHPLLRLYALKLLNAMVPFLGRRWRMQNTRVMSLLFHYVSGSVTDTTVACFACYDPLLPPASDVNPAALPLLDPADLPVPPEQHETEAHQRMVAQELNRYVYPAWCSSES